MQDKEQILNEKIKADTDEWLDEIEETNN